MADADEEGRRSTRQRGNPVSYKEPGELKISQLERPKDKEQAEDSSDEEDDNAEPSLKKAGKPAKKPRRASGASAASPAPRGRPATGNKLQARHSIDGTESLFDIVAHKPSAIPMALKQWWHDYDKNQAAAVCKLTNMMIEACGLPERLPLSAFSDDDEKDTDEYMTELVDACTNSKGDDFVGVSANVFDKKDKASKKVQANFSEFWFKFVDTAPEVELRTMHEHPFSPWIHAMSTSNLKVMRQVATTVGLDMMMGLVARTSVVLEKMTEHERLKEAASKKKETTEMARQTDQLNHKREVRKDCEQGITSFFQSVFIHRYKDLHAEVRAKCTETIGKLILEYSSKFLDNGYLKYIGWALYDKSTEVRSLALDAVDNFYNNKNILGNLDAFTTRFRARIFQMSYDVDKDVQLRAIETAKTMGQNGLLDDDLGHTFCEKIYKMVTEDDPDVRRAAASFVQCMYLDVDLATEYKQVAKKMGRNAPNRSIYMIKGIVELLNVVAAGFADLHPVMEPLVAEFEPLGDLDMLCTIMLEEESEDCLDEEQKATLGKMILGVVASTSELGEADESGLRMTKNKKPPGAVKKATLLLGEKLPKMMQHFAADPTSLTSLVGTLEHFQLDAFNAKDSTLQDIAKALVEITRTANEADLLQECAIALEHFSTANYPSKPAVEALIKNLFKTMAADFKKVADVFEKGSKPSTVQITAVRRMMVLSGHCDVFKSEHSIRTSAVKMLEPVANEDSPLAPETACHAMMIVSSYLSWRAKAHADDSVYETKEELVTCCKALFERGSDVKPQLRAQATACMADCQQLFGRHLTEEERPKDLDMPNNQIEEMLPGVDSELSRGAAQFVLGGEVLTINRAFVESEADPNGNMRFHALALLKPLVYAEVESEEFVCDILSTLTLHRPYPKKFHDDLLKTMQEHLEDQESLGEFWKVAHTRMCTRISDEIQSNKSRGVNNNKHTDDMFAAMVESVGNLKLSADDTNTYVLGGIEWVMDEWASTRAAFLDAIAVQVKKLDRDQTSSILSAFDEICSNRNVPMDTSIDDAEGVLPAVLKFRQFLQDQSSGVSRTAGRAPKGTATPGAKAKGAGGLPKARLTFTPSGTPMSSQASRASSTKGSGGRGSVSSKKRPNRQIGSDDEDAEGWVEVASAPSSQASSSAGKRRK